MTNLERYELYTELIRILGAVQYAIVHNDHYEIPAEILRLERLREALDGIEDR